MTPMPPFPETTIIAFALAAAGAIVGLALAFWISKGPRMMMTLIETGLAYCF